MKDVNSLYAAIYVNADFDYLEKKIKSSHDDIEIDFLKNDEFDELKCLYKPDGFLFFKSILDVECVNSKEEKNFEAVVRDTLNKLWNNNIPAVCSSDIEDMLPNNGGYKYSELPWPEGKLSPTSYCDLLVKKTFDVVALSKNVPDIKKVNDKITGYVESNGFGLNGGPFWLINAFDALVKGYSINKTHALLIMEDIGDVANYIADLEDLISWEKYSDCGESIELKPRGTCKSLWISFEGDEYEVF